VSRWLSRWFSDKNLTQKAYLNSAAAALDYAARLAVGFVINPLLVSGLGTFGYGAWQVLRQLMGYIGPASGRPTRALKLTIASEQALSNHEEKRQQVGAALLIWSMFLPVLGLLGGVVAYFAPVWLGAPPDMAWSVRWAAALLAAHVFIVGLLEVPRAALEGENLGYKRMGLSAALVLVGGGFTAAAVHLGTGLVGVAGALVLTGLLTGLLFLRVTRKHVPWFGVARPGRGTLRRFLGLSWWLLVYRLVNQVLRASDAVLLGFFDSVSMVTTYALTKFVPDAITSVVGVLVFGAMPGLGGIVGQGDLERANRIRGEIMAITWLITTVAGVTIVLWNGLFVGLWVGTEHFAGPVSTLLIVVMVTQFVLFRNDANVIDLTLDLRNKVLIGAAAGVLSVGTAALLVGRFDGGIAGLCVGFLAGRSVLSLSYPWMVGRALKIPMSRQLAGAARPALVAVILLGAAVGAEPAIRVASWPGLILGCATTLVVVGPVAWLAGLSGDLRGRILQRVRS
jgi:O-antigen/teichoic acid export membrane protein